jgi:hypothetical protein
VGSNPTLFTILFAFFWHPIADVVVELSDADWTSFWKVRGRQVWGSASQPRGQVQYTILLHCFWALSAAGLTGDV